MFKSEQLNSLFIEGLTPVFGAGLIFLLYGFCRYIAGANRILWREAVDSSGWLYCGLVISIHSAVICLKAETLEIPLGVANILCAILCGFTLIAAMTERGSTPRWQAPAKLKICAFCLVAFALALGYLIHGRIK
jgi:hypothetical protein